jgi:hypothetical protein
MKLFSDHRSNEPRKRLHRNEYLKVHNFISYPSALKILMENADAEGAEPHLCEKITNTLEYMIKMFKEIFYVRIRSGKLTFYRVGLTNEEWRTWMKDYDSSVDARSRFLWHSMPKRFVDWEEDDYYFSFYQGELQWYLEQISHRLKDCDFVINHRDQLVVPRVNGNPVPHFLSRPRDSFEYREPLLPVFSLCGREDFRDLLFMNPDDIYRVASSRFGIEFPARNYRKFVEPPRIPWKSRIPKLVFRGRPTGFGEAHNVRVQAYKYFQHNPHFDIGLTARMPTARKYYYHGSLLPAPQNRFSVAPTLEFQTFSRYKFILYIDGNVAAYRLATLFSTGCLVFILQKEFTMWCDPYLKHGYNCIHAHSFFELKELVDHYLRHEEEAQQIAQNGYETYKTYFASDFIFEWGIQQINSLN